MARLKPAFALAVAVACCDVSPARWPSRPAGDWRQTVFLYGMGAMIEGDAQVGPLQVPVDANLSDFFDISSSARWRPTGSRTTTGRSPGTSPT